MKRASYRHGIDWIALNDGVEERDPETIATQISVCLLADLFGKTPQQVAFDVLKSRYEGRAAFYINRGLAR